jgi:hypothetical protein
MEKENPSKNLSVGKVDSINIDYKNMKELSPSEQSVLDRKIKSIVKNIEEEAEDSVTKITFGKRSWAGKDAKATELSVGFAEKKPFSAAVLPDGKIFFSLRSKWASPELKSEVEDFLSLFKKKGGKSTSRINYDGVKVSPAIEREAQEVVSKLAADAKDNVKKITLTKKRVGGGASKGEKILFKVEFDNTESFLGVVTIDPSDLPGPGGIRFEPGDGDDGLPKYGMYTKRAFQKDDDGNVIKSKYKSTGNAPVSIKEVRRAGASIKAVFVDTEDGQIKRLEDAKWVEQSTRDAIMDFLASLRRDVLEENKNKEMKNEKDFKKQISEIADKIAGIKEYDQDKINLPDSIRAKMNSSIVNTKDLASALLDLLRELSANEPGMEDIENRSFKDVVTLLQRKAGLTTGKDAEQTPDVASGDQEKMGLPDLKEAYERIKKK